MKIIRVMKNYLLSVIGLFLCIIFMVSCSEENNSITNGIVDPNKEVADPQGTIQLSMRDYDNGRTYIGNIYIENENFKGNYCRFSSLGSVRGLGNVAYIPISGWAAEVAVIPGNGYVVYDFLHQNFYRIYVSDYIISTSGGIIGADVKYQEPFKGHDETILLETTSLAFPSTGGTQVLMFKNSGVILFDVEMYAPVSYSVEKASSYDLVSMVINSQNYILPLYNGIAITLGENTAAEAKTGIVALTTAYGKETIIDITIAGREPYISFDTREKEVSAAKQTEYVNLQTNISFNQLVVNSSVDWCKAELVNSTAAIYAKSNEVKFIGDQSVSKVGDSSMNYNTATSYSLKLTFDVNELTESREALITVSSKDGQTSSVLKIIQRGLVFEIEDMQIGFDKNAGSRTITINTTASDWDAQSSASWCTFSKNGNQIIVRVTTSTEDRIATITFKDFDATIVVHQSKYAVGDMFSENGVEGTVGYIGDEVRYVYKIITGSGSTAWSTEDVLTGANSEIDGEYNMNIIKKNELWQDFYPSLLLCERLNTNGIIGWYLPAINELKVLPVISSFCWSSTEIDEKNAVSWNGRQEVVRSKTSGCWIYAVHKF